MAETKPSFLSPGHSTVSAYVMADGAQKLIDFLAAVFGAETLLLHNRDDGSVMHASIRIGDSVVMIADPVGDYAAAPAMLHVYVADADATYAKALTEGATAIEPPSEKGDGDRRGGVRDFAGNSWWIATHIG